MSRTRSLERRNAFVGKIMATRALLARRFPNCFAARGKNKRPLAIGIDGLVVAACPDVPAPDLVRAIADYRSGPTYLRNVVAGAERIGLDGKPSGTVLPHQAENAAGNLKALQKKIAAEAAARRSRAKLAGARQAAEAVL